MPLQDLTPQLRTRLSRVERAVGWFVTLASLLLFAGFAYYIYHTANSKGWFKSRVTYFTFCKSSAGLKVGDPVKLMGRTIGSISKIEPMPADQTTYNIFVQFTVLEPYYGYIWTDSRARVVSADFLGRTIEVTRGIKGKPTVEDKERTLFGKWKSREITGLWNDKEGRYTPIAKAKGGYYLLESESPAVTERLDALVAQAEAALPNILEFTNKLSAVLSNTVDMTSNLNALVRKADPIVSNITQITTQLRNPHGALGEWAIPTNLNQLILTTLGSANMSVTNVNSRVSTLADSLNASLLNLANLTSNLNHQVQANGMIVSEISTLIVNTDDLLQGLKRHWALKGAFSAPGTNAVLQNLLQPGIGNDK